MKNHPRVAHIVSHTHWDREWYRTFHVYRTWLCRTVQAVMEALEGDSEFKHFLLDGQAVILEDYLEIHPEDKERLRNHIRAGRLSIGPWYILPDEFLVGAEAMVRNVLIGHRVCQEMGGWNQVGYMPDTFGHVAQMPQLLRQSKLDSFIYWRGNGDEIDELGLEYSWVAPDGSEVLAVQQSGGYCNAAGLGHREIWHSHTRKTVDLDLASKRVGELLQVIGERARSSVALLNNGCDHFPPQRDFARIMARLRVDFSDVEFRHSDLSEYLRDVRKCGHQLKSYRGELMSGKLAYVLSGVWSARMYLKQLNDRCQSLLSAYLEPLSAYVHFMLGWQYPAGAIAYAWKLLLKNHPHDSICGCSIDEVHAEMIPRFRGVIDTTEETMVRQMEALAPEFAREDAGDRDTVLCVANTLPHRRSAVIERLVILQPCCADVDHLRLVDSRGRELPHAIIDLAYVERFWGVDYRLFLNVQPQLDQFEVYRRDFGPRILRDKVETPLTDRYVLLQFVADELPPVGHVNYCLTDRPATATSPSLPQPVTIQGSTIENAFCRVVVHPNATFDLTDKSTGRTYQGLNFLEDTEDIGDEYDYAPCEKTETITAAGIAGAITTYRDSGLVGALEVQFDLALPSAIMPDRSARTKDRVACRVRARIGLNALNGVVDIKLEVENLARDHRLRARFPFGIKTDRIWSDGHFYVNARPLDRPDGSTWVQPSPRTYPQQEFSAVEDDRGGLAVFNRGLPEMEPLNDGTGGVGMAMTLLRCVGWLSRDDFSTRRRQNAGPTLCTPDAQCIGTHRFEYAVMPYVGNWLSAGVRHACQAWRVPPLVVQGVEDLQVPGGAGLVEATSSHTAITAIKKHETRDTLVVRVFNQSDTAVTETLRLGKKAEAAWRTNLLEEREEKLSMHGDQILEVVLGPHKIATIEIEFEKHSS